MALARAFIRSNAQLLILDEPSAALDPRSEYALFKKFITLAQNRTTILISHRLSSIAIVDRILVFKDGVLVEDGTHEQLLEQAGEYAELWHMQSENYRH